MNEIIRRNPLWTIASALLAALILWLIIAPWPAGMEEAFGRKQIFLNALFNGITLGALYFPWRAASR